MANRNDPSNWYGVFGGDSGAHYISPRSRISLRYGGFVCHGGEEKELPLFPPPFLSDEKWKETKKKWIMLNFIFLTTIRVVVVTVRRRWTRWQNFASNVRGWKWTGKVKCKQNNPAVAEQTSREKGWAWAMQHQMMRTMMMMMLIMSRERPRKEACPVPYRHVTRKCSLRYEDNWQR